MCKVDIQKKLVRKIFVLNHSARNIRYQLPTKQLYKHSSAQWLRCLAENPFVRNEQKIAGGQRTNA